MIYLPLITPIVAFLIHSLVNRVVQSRSQQRVCMLSSVAATLVVLMVSWAEPLQNLWTLITALGFGYCYFHLFNISETAIRPQILSRLAKDPRLDSGMCASYDDGSRVEHRLARLEAFGAVERLETGYVLKPSLMGLFGRIFCHSWVRKVFDYQGGASNEPI